MRSMVQVVEDRGNVGGWRRDIENVLATGIGIGLRWVQEESLSGMSVLQLGIKYVNNLPAKTRCRLALSICYHASVASSTPVSHTLSIRSQFRVHVEPDDFKIEPYMRTIEPLSPVVP
jgi:hypothetical protein